MISCALVDSPYVRHIRSVQEDHLSKAVTKESSVDLPVHSLVRLDLLPCGTWP
jgi:hypothetical protein